MEQTPVLQMRSDKNILDATFQKLHSLSSLLRSTTSDGSEHSIRDFLARPRLLTSFDWNNTAAFATTIQSIDLPSYVITDRIFAAKVAGFAFFRATVVVRVMINSQRFQAGRLLLSWMPLCKQNMTKYNDTKYLVYQTQRPRVEFDISTDTEVIMRIPYVHSALAFDLTTGANDAGRLDFIVYGKLSSGLLKVNLYFSFEDVELSFATEPGTYIAQAGGGVKSTKKSRGSKDPGDAEAAAMGVRPVSSMLSSLATTAGIGAHIPLISSVAGPVSWAAGLAARAAHSFGYAKPLMLAPRVRFYDSSVSHRVNCDGAHMAISVGLFEDNKVRHLPGFAGSDLDEMAISSVIGTFAYWQVANWTTSLSEGDFLFNNQRTAPQAVATSSRTQTVAANTAATVFDTGPLAYISYLFRYYRGSIKLKFKVVKTEFHSGRLRFAYYLRSDYTTSGFPAQSSANVHTSIFDLRDSTEFEVTLPFAACTSYISTTVDYARWWLRVETPLIAAGDAPSSIQVLCEVAAADDFEFAVPVPFAWTPCSSAFSQIGAQAGVGSESSTQQTLGDPAPPVGGSSITEDSNMNAESCIGEKILSFRQLLKRHTNCLKVVQQVQPWGIGTWHSVPRFSFSPTSMVLPNSIQPTNFRGNANSSVWWQPDYFTYVGVMFAQLRGSVRYGVSTPGGATLTFDDTVVPNNVFNDNYSVHAYGGTPFGYSWQPGQDPAGPGGSWVYNKDGQLPYYSRVPSTISPIGPWTIGDQATPLVNPGPTTCFQPPCQVVYGGGPDFSTENLTYYYRTLCRAIGEDFSMGYFTGTYPITAVNTSQPYRNVA